MRLNTTRMNVDETCATITVDIEMSMLPNAATRENELERIGKLAAYVNLCADDWLAGEAAKAR